MSLKAVIETKLNDAFAPTDLAVVDESYLHASHAQAPEGGESHFRVRLVSQAFSGKSRVARQRAVYEALAEEMAGGLHALRLEVMTPDEANAA
ncbi:MAG: BolA family protein [Parvularcula sp.]